jgi:anti-sigma factor RsiW
LLATAVWEGDANKMSGDQIQLAHRYHDGELSSADRAAFESHLASCGECRELLGELASLSQTLRTASLPAAGPSLQERIFDAWEAAQALRERGVRRMAGWLTAAAAAVLLLGLVGWPSESRGPSVVELTPTASAAETWEVAAVMPPDQRAEESGSPDLAQVAQWMATDLGANSGAGVRH